MPIFSMFVFGIIGFTTMLAQPVVLVWAQRTVPEYKSIAAGFVNGFAGVQWHYAYPDLVLWRKNLV